ncbi:uncharacterized protein Nmag_0155 [Natrialba magadii ATCC 43099]|uniref:Uncharacterized protein n=1 Tax=Natrialba magadii (strain ATCC 43099 / DSM 3394 / CCM 3739 / CIP 104546 / IAM 13178 / JCM 8861 / NBRC 102185 / NCIMB 2190 / MS3) TaxID=547559 RepID=D3SWF5_NATMM|nr:hypothetical protein [Natrialba magadii]ADD03747.1 uncharacterized protein Nmag_0155 [Natrialba magadii ATCC 43099]ELY33803.1 hypothetical protein C500_01218 [Natrialba magadii ATCC 43099]
MSDNPTLESLHERIAALESELECKSNQIAELKRDCDRLEARLESASEVESGGESDTRTESDTEPKSKPKPACNCTCQCDPHTAKLEAALKKAATNKARIEELQARELEKGAHLAADHIDPHELDVPGNQLEQITKDDGRTYVRLPESADPLDDGHTTLAFGDLLPIQQLARMDADRRRATANALPTRLAARLWQARTDPQFGDDPWQAGCKDVREYVTASDLKHWIRRQEPGTSESYAKKLVSRTIDALLDLSKHRLAVHRTTQRKNGLEYTERRLVLPADADLPGETVSSEPPETAGVHG